MSRSSRRMILPDRVFGRSAVNRMSSGRAMAPIFLTTCSFKSSARSLVMCAPSFRGTNAATACPLISCDRTTTAASATRALTGPPPPPRPAAPAARHIDDIVPPAEEPEVPVGVALRAVAGDVDARAPFAPVLPHVAIGIAVDAAQHRRPRTRQGEQAAAD